MAGHALSLVSAEWDLPEPGVNNNSIFSYLKKEAPDGRVYVEQGSVTEGHAAAKQVVETEFYKHYVVHALMEPNTVLAQVINDKLRSGRQHKPFCHGIAHLYPRTKIRD